MIKYTGRNAEGILADDKEELKYEKMIYHSEIEDIYKSDGRY